MNIINDTSISTLWVKSNRKVLTEQSNFFLSHIGHDLCLSHVPTIVILSFSLSFSSLWAIAFCLSTSSDNFELLYASLELVEEDFRVMRLEDESWTHPDGMVAASARLDAAVPHQTHQWVSEPSKLKIKKNWGHDFIVILSKVVVTVSCCCCGKILY